MIHACTIFCKLYVVRNSVLIFLQVCGQLVPSKAKCYCVFVFYCLNEDRMDWKMEDGMEDRMAMAIAIKNSQLQIIYKNVRCSDNSLQLYPNSQPLAPGGRHFFAGSSAHCTCTVQMPLRHGLACKPVQFLCLCKYQSVGAVLEFIVPKGVNN